MLIYPTWFFSFDAVLYAWKCSKGKNLYIDGKLIFRAQSWCQAAVNWISSEFSIVVSICIHFSSPLYAWVFLFLFFPITIMGKEIEKRSRTTRTLMNEWKFGRLEWSTTLENLMIVEIQEFLDMRDFGFQNLSWKFSPEKQDWPTLKIWECQAWAIFRLLTK